MKFDEIISKKRWTAPVLTVLARDDGRVRDAAAKDLLFAQAARTLSAKL